MLFASREIKHGKRGGDVAEQQIFDFVQEGRAGDDHPESRSAGLDATLGSASRCWPRPDVAVWANGSVCWQLEAREFGLVGLVVGGRDCFGHRGTDRGLAMTERMGLRFEVEARVVQLLYGPASARRLLRLSTSSLRIRFIFSGSSNMGLWADDSKV